jgi:RNA polymerase sigma-70 factor (ECF subfamily)
MSESATAVLPSAMTRSPPLDVEALWRSCADDLPAYACPVVRDPAAAEEVVAVTFERALRRRARFDRRRGEPRAWLFGIARNAAVDELRRRGRGAELTHDPPDATVADHADALADRDEAVRRAAVVAAAIDALPGRDRELVALKFHAGLSNAEIARVLGISTTNAGSRLHRVLTHLREACRAAL